MRPRFLAFSTLCASLAAALLISARSAKKKEVLPLRPETITIAAVGDIFLQALPSGWTARDAGRLFEHAHPFLDAADIAFGNLETPLCAGGNPAKTAVLGRVFILRGCPDLAPALASASFDVVSLANNHCLDFGRAGLESTRDILTAQGIQHACHDGSVAEFLVRGVRIGIVAFSTSPAARCIVRPERAFKEIEELSSEFDILIVSVHAGREGSRWIPVRDEEESFLDERRGNPRRFAREAVRRGADLVLMHGPHVPRSMEVADGRLIAYSLGNFCTAGSPVGLREWQKLAPLLQVELDSSGKLVKAGVVSFRQEIPGIPEIDPELTALRVLEEISRTDFPQSHPSLEDGTGLIAQVSEGQRSPDVPGGMLARLRRLFP